VDPSDALRRPDARRGRVESAAGRGRPVLGLPPVAVPGFVERVPVGRDRRVHAALDRGVVTP
jgi:hypothetical protein